MEKFPFYYEVSTYDDGHGEMHEGGFLMAEDHGDAMAQLCKLYEPGLKSAHIEYMEKDLFAFPIDKARIAKDWVNENGSY